jgi:hypothetical protein
MAARRLAVPAAAAAFALALVPAAAGAPTLLHATVGPYRVIQLQDAEGTAVERVRAGLVSFRIRDHSSTVSFCLKGPGMNRALATLAFAGTRTVTLRLRRGAYTYYDASEPGAMRGTFRVV